MKTHRRDERTIDGEWSAQWVIRAPWAHPVWSDYILCAFDLHERPGDDPVTRYAFDVTHEISIHALDPRQPVDMDRDDFWEHYYATRFRMLRPVNHGFQIKRDTNEAVSVILNEIAEKIIAQRLNPDTDARQQWERLISSLAGVSFYADDIHRTKGLSQ